MILKKYLVAFIALSLVLAIPAIANAQGEYSDVITDEEGDVFHWHGTGWDYNVERPNIDIIRAEISESGGNVTISLTVKGEITDGENILYYIFLTDGEGGSYNFYYNDDHGYIIASSDKGYRNFEPNISGAGTDTLSVSCSLEDLLTPDMLRFTSVLTYEYTEDGWYQDTASPEDVVFLPINYELYVEPTIGVAPLEVDITVSVENTGDADGQIPLTVDGEPIYTMELGPQERKSEYTTHTFKEAGVYTVEFGDQSVTVYAQVDEDDEYPSDEDPSDDNGNNDDDNGDYNGYNGENGNDYYDDIDEEFFERLWARGMWCIAIVILIPLVVVVVIIVLVIKMISSDDKKDQQQYQEPPQQGTLPPPPPENKGRGDR